MKTWYIYQNGNNIGQAKNIYETIKHIEALIGHRAEGIEVSTSYIRYVDVATKDIYTAKREELK